MKDKAERKALIGVLASHDDPGVNQRLVLLFNWMCNSCRKILENFHFVFTGGTFDRLFQGTVDTPPISWESAEFLLKPCRVTRLPSREEGGVPILSSLVTQRLCSIVWAFWGPYQYHWLRPENLALMRLCDQAHVKRLMNCRSVEVWLVYEAECDKDRNPQTCPPTLTFRQSSKWEWEYICGPSNREPSKNGTNKSYQQPHEKPFEYMTVALIAHDQMKSRMIEFAIDHESELKKFGSILATGTTGRDVGAATSKEIEEKIFRYHSGPKGGDIEIATEIILGHCDIVIFFVDPMQPHAHREDILVVFEACMMNPQVLMITNEMHAREFMTRVVRGRRGI